ncbi:hypothetical protein BC835DRAFT_357158 [Cytidiella melzeri]|nr:hypothetical protein BC835DRAFT_357158 [Cytidiella melzeri]
MVVVVVVVEEQSTLDVAGQLLEFRQNARAKKTILPSELVSQHLSHLPPIIIQKKALNILNTSRVMYRTLLNCFANSRFYQYRGVIKHFILVDNRSSFYMIKMVSLQCDRYMYLHRLKAQCYERRISVRASFTKVVVQTSEVRRTMSR